MDLWIDNTGLQTAGRCLSRVAESDYDVRGLLQLATLIIYGDKLELNGFEENRISTRSRELRQQLIDLGLESEALSIADMTRDAYSLACQTTAQFAASELQDRFQPDEHDFIGCEPPHLPPGMTERQVLFVDLARERDDSYAVCKSLESALDDQAVGAVEYMLAVSPELRAAIAKMMRQHPKWSHTHSYQLNVFLRYYLNDTLAGQALSTYAPAVGRAELVHRRNSYVRNELIRVVDTVVNEIRTSPLGIPSVDAALIDRSKGEPTALLAEAIEMRSRSAELRSWLRRHVERFKEDTSEGRFEIQKNIRELGEQLRKDIGIQRAPTLGDAVDFQFVIGLPAVSISGTKLLEWLRYRLASRRIAALTDIVKSTAYCDHSDQSYATLVQNCMSG